MVAPSYVAKKVDGTYELVRADVVGTTQRSLWGVAGGALAVLGLCRRGVLGWSISAIGADLIYFGITGHGISSYLFRSQAHGGAPGSGPSYAHGHEQEAAAQRPADAVEEASMESFPASDAPAHTRTTTH